MNILITEPKDYSKKALAIYKKLGQVYFLSDLDKLKKEKVFNQTDIIAVGLAYQLDEKFLGRMPHLKIIASPATGMNHMDTGYIRNRRIKIVSLRGRKGFLKNVPSTAEETFALILALARKLPWAFDYVKNGGWDRLEWRGHQLVGKTIGLLGFGRLGRIVARYAKAFGMKILVCDPNVSAAFIKSRGAVKSDMEKLFKESDIVSLHVLLTDQTGNLVKEKHLKMMKSSTYL